MKLSDFFKSIFGTQHVDAVNASIDKVKAATDAGGFLNGVRDLVSSGVQIVEDASNTLKTAGDPGLAGAEKHDLVKNAVLDAVVTPVEKAIPTPPGTSQDAFGSFLRVVLGGLVSILINAAVSKFNSSGIFKHL